MKMTDMKTQIIAICLMLASMNAAAPAAPEINQAKLPDEVRATQVRDMKWGMFICWSFKGYQVAEFAYPILPGHKGGAQWFYSLPQHDNLCHPADKLYQDYQGAVENGNIFSIDVGPDYTGSLREIDIKTLKQVGGMIRAGHSK